MSGYIRNKLCDLQNQINNLPDSDNQTLSIAGCDLTISNGNTVDLSDCAPDPQTLDLEDCTLTISDGNSVDLTECITKEALADAISNFQECSGSIEYETFSPDCDTGDLVDGDRICQDVRFEVTGTSGVNVTGGSWVIVSPEGSFTTGPTGTFIEVEVCGTVDSTQPNNILWDTDTITVEGLIEYTCSPGGELGIHAVTLSEQVCSGGTNNVDLPVSNEKSDCLTCFRQLFGCNLNDLIVHPQGFSCTDLPDRSVYRIASDGENGINRRVWNNGDGDSVPHGDAGDIFTGPVDPITGMPTHPNPPTIQNIDPDWNVTNSDFPNDGSDQLEIWAWIDTTGLGTITIRDDNQNTGERGEMFIGKCCGTPILQPGSNVGVDTGAVDRGMLDPVSIDEGIHFIYGRLSDFSAFNGFDLEYDDGSGYSRFPINRTYTQKPYVECRTLAGCEDTPAGWSACYPSLCVPVGLSVTDVQDLIDASTSDDQQISLAGNILTLEDGGTVDLSAFLDNSDDQTITAFTLSPAGVLTLTIEDGNTVTVDLSSLDTDTDDQTLSLAGTLLTIADGNTVDLAAINTDSQTLSTTVDADGNTTAVTISNGNTVPIIHPDQNIIVRNGVCIDVGGVATRVWRVTLYDPAATILSDIYEDAGNPATTYPITSTIVDCCLVP